MQKFGIDVSKWNGKNFDFKKAKSEGVEFVIIRGAYSNRKDVLFDSYYNACKTLNMPIGVFLYSMAKNVTEARTEADNLINNVLKNKKFEYPIYIDVEDKTQAALGKNKLTEIIIAFCDTLEKAGYYVGIYSGYNYLKNNTNVSKLNKYDKWISQWANKCTSPIAYQMWQFGGETNKIRSTKIAGVVTDQSYCYVDYPKIIKNKGLNNLNVKEVAPKPVPVVKNLETIAKEVIAGKWGNGSERKQKLTAAGYDYNAVQIKVNKLLNITDKKTNTKIIKYTVKKKDNLTMIANKFGVNVNQIVKLNNIKNPNLIVTGQVLRIK